MGQASWDNGRLDGIRCFEAGLRDRMLFGRPYRKSDHREKESNTDGDSAGGSFVFPVPRGRKSIARVRKPLETGTNTCQNPNGVNVGRNCDQSQAKLGGAYGLCFPRVAAEVTGEGDFQGFTPLAIH